MKTSFRSYFHYCLSSVHYCEDRFHIHNDLLLSVVMKDETAMIVRPQASTLDFGYVSILRKYVSSFFRICYVDTCEETTLTFTEVSFWTSRSSSFSAASHVDKCNKENSRRIKKT